MLEGSSVFSVVFERSPKCINRPNQDRVRSMGIVMQQKRGLLISHFIAICLYALTTRVLVNFALRNIWAPAKPDRGFYHIGPQWTKRLLLTGNTITCQSDAALIGLVLKSVSRRTSRARSRGGSRIVISWIDPEMLSTNKRIINIGMELMGSHTLQRLAAENDAAQIFQAAKEVFPEKMSTEGLNDRDACSFRARIIGPEIRDEDGTLVDEE